MNVLDEKRSSPELRGYVKERIRKMQDVMARKGVERFSSKTFIDDLLRYTFFIKSESYMEKWTGLLGPSGNPRKK